MFENYDDIVDVDCLCEMLKIGRSKAYLLLSKKDQSLQDRRQRLEDSTAGYY